MLIIAAAICSCVAYLIGAAIANEPGINLPGFGVALTVITMGIFIMVQIRMSNKNKPE